MSVSQRILASLRIDGPGSVATIARRIGAVTSTVSERTRRMHRSGRVHVVAWQGSQRAVYAAGAGNDAVRPVPRTAAQRSATSRRDPVVRLARIMSDRKRRARVRAPPPQSWLSALNVQ